MEYENTYEKQFVEFCDKLMPNGLKEYEKIRILQMLRFNHQYGVLPPRTSKLMRLMTMSNYGLYPTPPDIGKPKGFTPNQYYVDELAWVDFQNKKICVDVSELIEIVHSSERMRDFCTGLQFRIYSDIDQIHEGESMREYVNTMRKWIQAHFYFVDAVYGWRRKYHLYSDIHISSFNGKLDVLFTYDDLYEHQPKPCWRIVNKDGRPVREIFMGIMI